MEVAVVATVVVSAAAAEWEPTDEFLSTLRQGPRRLAKTAAQRRIRAQVEVLLPPPAAHTLTYQCPQCPWRTTIHSTAAQYKHLYTHHYLHLEDHACGKCRRVFCRPNALERHLDDCNPYPSPHYMREPVPPPHTPRHSARIAHCPWRR